MIKSTAEVFVVFLRLGLTSFGGPIAHLSYFHDEFVKRKKWIDEHAYADLVALCQFLPGPASSQVGMAIGLSRASYLGAIAAWIGFTLPSAIILVLFGLGISSFHLSDSWLHGLKIVAVAVVAQAIWGMAVKLCPDKQRATIAVIAAVTTAMISSGMIQFFVIAFGGIIGVLFLRKHQELPHEPMKTRVSKTVGFALLLIFATLLVALPFAAKTSGDQSLKLFDSFFRAGSLVFGGGHVVLPLLQAEVVPTGWVSKEMFMAGYGAAQAIPGPLFSFSAYLGAVSNMPPSGWLGALICLISAFLPSFLLIVGVLPFWEKMRRHSEMRYAMQGINAAVVGLLISAFYNPVWTSAIFSPKDFALAAVCFLLLVFWTVPSWIVVLLSAVAGRVLL
jgi:chromate transporter